MRWLAAIACLASLQAGAQGLVSITADADGSWFSTFEVGNQGEVIDSIRLEVTGPNAVIDWVMDEPAVGIQEVPDVGGNNDGLAASAITWPGVNLGPDEFFMARIDIDTLNRVDPDTITVVIGFATGPAQTLNLVQSGLTWSANIEGQRPPDLIIDGEASITLTWLPPTTLENGVPIVPADLAGYVLYWDTQSGADRCGPRPAERLDDCYGNALDLADGSLESVPFTIALDGPTTLYFRMIAYTLDAEGQDLLSVYSNEPAREFVLEVTVPPPDPTDPPPAAPIIQDIQMQVTCTTNVPGVTCEFSVQ